MNASDDGPGDVAQAIHSLPQQHSETARSAGGAKGRHIVVVLGMHRSGTSLLSNILHYLGADMADQSDHVSLSNPAGFWERPAITAVQDEILKSIARPIDDPRHSLPFPAGWWRAKGVQAHKRQLRALVTGYLEQTPGAWGFKDPRTCRLLPLWWEIFEELDLQPRYVWAIRTPGEASASMANKNPAIRPMTPALAEVTWLAYNYDVLRYTSAANRIAVDYNSWFETPEKEASRLQQKLQLPGLASETETSHCVRQIVEASYRHQHEGKGKAIAQIAIAETLFRDVVRSDPGHGNPELNGYLSVLDVVFRALSPFVDLLREVPALRRELRIAKKQLAKLASAPDNSAGVQQPLGRKSQ